ncbi:YolD-like family protein [Paenibacillus sonchi]|uniref:YolD-like family protein n=1 Tax=Paenibacillus sonchi TaxID=373687 RepID=A0A974PD41_9BACL|nr:YolD-like family protein [Paenibacillus sonchi]QQZ61173.1 YolD-like family protein [Paenibacillus sonchi]
MIRKIDGDLLDKESIILRTKPKLTMVQLLVIKSAINKSIEDHSPLWLKVFYFNYDRVLHGIVMTADYQLQRIELRTIGDQSEWIKIEDILNVN